MTDAECTVLEEMVDAHGLTGVLDALADVCADKASHIRAIYQDRETAKVWDRQARAVGRLADRLFYGA